MLTSHDAICNFSGANAHFYDRNRMFIFVCEWNLGGLYFFFHLLFFK